MRLASLILLLMLWGCGSAEARPTSYDPYANVPRLRVQLFYQRGAEWAVGTQSWMLADVSDAFEGEARVSWAIVPKPMPDFGCPSSMRDADRESCFAKISRWMSRQPRHGAIKGALLAPFVDGSGARWMWGYGGGCGANFAVAVTEKTASGEDRTTQTLRALEHELGNSLGAAEENGTCNLSDTGVLYCPTVSGWSHANRGRIRRCAGKIGRR